MFYYTFLILISCVCCVISHNYKIHQITQPLNVSESPHWDHKQKCLYFVSLGEPGVSWIHKYVPATKKHTKTKIDGYLGFMVPVEGTSNKFLLGVDRKFQVVRWNGKDGSPASVVKTLGQVDCDVPFTRINDGKADPRGRVFAGTFGNGTYPVFELHKGSLFRLDGSKITKVARRISLSNGLAWDLKRKAMYYTDSLEYKIRRYDYDVETGQISNLKYIFDLKKNNIEGFPDGITIDTDGNLWVACFDGWNVIKINPKTGKLLQKIRMPSLEVSSVCFGGPNFDILFVTTADLQSRGDPDGAVFKVTGLGVKGLPANNFKL